MPRGPKSERRPADVIGNAGPCHADSDGKKNPVAGAGDTWTWTAIEADTKLIVSHFVGGRDRDCAAWFMRDVAERVANRIQITSDGHRAYLEAIGEAFGADVDYAMLNKIYGPAPDAAKGRYSPAECIGAKKDVITGDTAT